MLAIYQRLTLAVAVALVLAICVESCAIKEIRSHERPTPATMLAGGRP